MTKCPVLTLKGEAAGSLEMKIEADLNEALIAQALRCEVNHIFSKSGKTKVRSEVSGGGKKPWKQKGTGRARAGSIRSPLFRGGGITFGPTGENKTLRIPKKMRKAAIRQLLSRKIANEDLVIIDDMKVSGSKTKAASSALTKIVPTGKILILYIQGELALLKPYLNLAQVEIRALNNLLLFDLIKDSKIVASKSTASDLAKLLK